ncbi:MAG: DUF4317 domain-containing protein [Butyrivibrio sp.]|nr:DUF4317 domain-containing protein [Butyrivibrio sp.]
MNKTEISEIKKLFKSEKCCISRICGCYVDGNKNKVTTFREAFLSLPEEEIFKYFTIFRASLSGTLGKNLINMEFPLDAEADGGAQDFLLRLRDSRLKDDELLELFYNRVIENYTYGENYLILLINASYDVPQRTSDGFEAEDASDYVYEHILCSICPVNLSKEGLCYNSATNSIENRVRDWLVEAPAHAFLFPAFNDRNSDIHGLLFYTRGAENLQSEFVDGMFGCAAPLTQRGQKETFSEIISEALGDECRFEAVKAIHEQLNNFVEERKELPEPVVFGKADLKRALEAGGASAKQIERFEADYDEAAGSRAEFVASNVISSRSFEIKAPDVVIKVAPDRTDLLETREIDGRTFLMIELTDSVEINGINAKPL